MLDPTIYKDWQIAEDAEERLPEYLAHPLTRKLEGKVGDHIEKKKVFDHY